MAAKNDTDSMYMSVPAAGLVLRCDSSTIYRMCQRGQLDALFEDGRRVAIGLSAEANALRQRESQFHTRHVPKLRELSVINIACRR